MRIRVKKNLFFKVCKDNTTPAIIYSIARNREQAFTHVRCLGKPPRTFRCQVILPSHIAKSLDLFPIQSLVYINPLFSPRPSSSEASVLLACAFQHPTETERKRNGAEARSAGTGQLRRIRSGAKRCTGVQGVLMLRFRANTRRSGGAKRRHGATCHYCFACKF